MLDYGRDIVYNVGEVIVMDDKDNGVSGSDNAGAASSNAGKVKPRPTYTPYAPDDLPEGYKDTAVYKRLPNGAVFDLRIKRIVANPGGGNTLVKQGINIKEIHAERVLRAKIAAQGALSELVIASGKNKSAVGGWARVVSAQAELALDTDRGRASTDAARFVGQATGFLSSDRDNKADSGGGSVQDTTISLLAGALAGFVHLGGVASAGHKSDNTAPHDNDSVIDSEWVE